MPWRTRPSRQSFGLHRWWKRRLIRWAAPQAGDAALDLCCGTGDVAFRLASHGVHVTGLDFSQAMLEVAARRAASEVAGRGLLFQQGDALRTGLADNAYDIVTISYGLRNLADWKQGLREMWRVAKPGGRVLVLDFGKPDALWWRGLYFAYLKNWVPRFGRWFFRDADTHGYIYESLLNYPAQRGVEAEMSAMGFQDVRVVNILGGIMGINVGRKPAALVAQTA
ncbi:MAG: ubiquinone/menaquinone biosynthesis methyltransferase [Verrucomicrobia bacterium]|nr:ubiquinone/menaquinone biosynthesis methyltransferase [Verrucomicrobiota bacterium]